MSLNTTGSTGQVTQLSSRTVDGAGTMRPQLSTREFGDALHAIFPSAAQRSATDSSSVIAQGGYVPGLAGSPFMPTSAADISSLRNAARVSTR